MGVCYNPRIVTDGLILCLDAGNTKSYPGSGTAWTDLSGNGNNGTLTNGPTYNSAGYFTFDSIDDEFSASGFNCNKTYFSLEWWMYPTDNMNYNQAIQLNDGWGDFNWHTGANSQFWCGTSLSGRFSDSNAGSVAVNTWQQWTFTFNNGTGTIYKNGISLQSGGLIASSRAYYTSISSPTGSTKGRRSIVRIYSNKVLSVSEIQQNFNATRGRYGI